jgi:hypothetical protein
VTDGGLTGGRLTGGRPTEGKLTGGRPTEGKLPGGGLSDGIEAGIDDGRLGRETPTDTEISSIDDSGDLRSRAFLMSTSRLRSRSLRFSLLPSNCRRRRPVDWSHSNGAG